MITRIEDGRYILRIRVRKPEAEVKSEAVAYKASDFWREFMDEGAYVKAPRRSCSSRDIGIITNLLRKYSREDLMRFADEFWHKHSQPIFNNPSISVMQLFAARIPDIKRDLGV